MNGISMDWFYDTRDVDENLFDKIVAILFENGKITRFSYNIFRVKDSPSDTEKFWCDALNVDDDVDRSIINENNFNCSIETQLRAFYFKIFHKAICTNKFQIKLAEVILLFFISVKQLMRPWCICFVNMRRFLPCGMIWSLSFKTKGEIVLTYQIIRKCLVWRLGNLSITMSLIFCFYIFNFISIDVNFRIIPHPFKHLKT